MSSYYSYRIFDEEKWYLGWFYFDRDHFWRFFPLVKVLQEFMFDVPLISLDHQEPCLNVLRNPLRRLSSRCDSSVFNRGQAWSVI